MKLVKLLIGLVLFLVAAVFVVGFFADGIAKEAIETGGSYALGVDTRVEGVDIGFLGGTFALNGLAVANPEGRGAGSFLEMGSGSLEVSAASLLSDKIEVPEIAFEKIRVQLVQGAQGSNYGQILDNLKRFQGGGGGASGGDGGGGEAAEEGGGKRFVIRKLRMSDLEVEVVPVPELRLAAVSIPIPSIELENIGTEADKGVLLSELAGIVVEAILKSAAMSGRLPGGIQGALDGKLSQLQGLADAGVRTLDGLLPPGLGGGLDGAKDAARDAAKDALKGLGIGR